MSKLKPGVKPKSKKEIKPEIEYTTISGKYAKRLTKEQLHQLGVDDVTNKSYTFLVSLAFAGTIKLGDIVVVRSYDIFLKANVLRFVKVVSIHPTPMIEEEHLEKYKWAFQRIDTNEIEVLEKLQAEGKIGAGFYDDVPFSNYELKTII